MAEMSKDQMDYVDKLGDAKLEIDKGNVDYAIEKYNELWDGIPEPKYEYSESYLVAWYMMDVALLIKDTKLMREWIPHIMQADPERYDSGEREMYAGLVEYECEDFEKAYEYFDIAKKKSSGRCFRKCDLKYKDFYLNYSKDKKTPKKKDTPVEKCPEPIVKIANDAEPKELSDEVYDKIEALSEQGNDYCDDENWKKAITCFNKALKLLPEPKDNWEAATWLYASLGEAYFFSEKYEEAADNLNSARMCPEGMANPFVLLRLGESYYELGEMESAQKYLLEAYMMEGEEIFEDEDEKYLKAIEKLL